MYRTNIQVMSYNFTILKQTENGMLVLLKGYGNYQLTYKNLNLSLTKTELCSFEKHLKEIDINYWEKEYENSIYEKKIPIPTLQSNLMLLINRQELQELVKLIDYQTQRAFLKHNEINYNIVWN